MDSQAGIDALFLFATEGILVMNEQGEIARINPSAERLFGYDAGELVGQKIEILIPKRFAETHQAHREKYNNQPRARSMGLGFDLFASRKDKSEFPVEISLSPYTTAEGKFVIAFIIDITVRRQAEENLKNYSADLEMQVKNRTLILEEAIDELEKTKMELREALEKERDLNELKSRFVSMASHEFRTPLATIMSSLALVKKYGDVDDREKQNKHIGRIKSSINTLTDILNDFLSVSKLEEGKVTCVPESFVLESFVTDIFTGLQGIVKDRQILSHKHRGDVTVMLDKKLLQHVLFNLISNAIKFSSEGSVVQVLSERGETDVSITVQDSGIGIPEEDQKHLFERFFRAQNAIHIQGTGLGLNIVTKYVELMGGTVSFASKENEGTSFTLRIPQ